MVMYIITSKLNSTLGTIGKATGVKMTAKAVGKNSNFCVSVKCGHGANGMSAKFSTIFLLLNIGFFASA